MSDIVKILKTNHEKVMTAIKNIGKTNECCNMEAATQYDHLKTLGLNEEFPYGCDSIKFVAIKLLEERKKNKILKTLINEISFCDSIDQIKKIIKIEQKNI